MLNQVRIEYDDDQLDVVEKINKALRPLDLVLVDDGQPHEGYCIFTLRTISSATPDPKDLR